MGHTRTPGSKRQLTFWRDVGKIRTESEADAKIAPLIRGTSYLQKTSQPAKFNMACFPILVSNNEISHEHTRINPDRFLHVLAKFFNFTHKDLEPSLL